MATNHQQPTATKKFTKEELGKIRDHLFPKSGNDTDFARCIVVTEQYGLSPFLGEIHYVERSEKNDDDQWVKKIIPMVGRDGYLTIAHKSGKFEGGIRSWAELKEVPVLQADGSFKLILDLAATAEVWQAGATKPTVVTVFFREYAARTRTGNLTSMWKNKSITMLCKVGESQGLRKAFSIHGLYSAEEMGSGEMVGNQLIYDPESVNVTGPPTGSNNDSDAGTGNAGTAPEVAGSKLQPGTPSSTGTGATPLFINSEQYKRVKDLIIDTRTVEAEFCKAYRIAALDKLPAAQFDHAVKALEKKKQPGTTADQVSGADNSPQGNNLAETLKARNIPFEVTDGNILAKPKFSDAGAREFLKEQGFKWDPTGKAWKYAA